MPDKPDELVRYIEKRVLIIVALLALTFLVGGYTSWMLGVVVGGFASLIFFKSIVKVAKAVIIAKDANAKITTAKSSGLRQILTLLLLGLSYFLEGLSFPAVVVGLLLVKIIIVSKHVQAKFEDTLNLQMESIRRRLERRN